MTPYGSRVLATMTLVVACVWCGLFSVSAASAAPSPAPMSMATMLPDQIMHVLQSPTASPVSDRVWSIFNHRGAGWFLFFWGLTALIAGLQWQRRPWLRFAPPLVLLGLVEFLILRNDPKAWPTGPIGFWISFQDPEVFQHRVFVLLLLVIAIVEFLRAADRLPKLLREFALPALAVFGATFLFLHKHGGLEMQMLMQQSGDPTIATDPAAKHMVASMAQIKHEHLWFSLIGLGLAATKLLADMGRLRGPFANVLWCIFAMLLGLYMVGYTE